MGRQEKLKRRLLSKPSDFTYDEMVTLLAGFGYVVSVRPRSTGSAVVFYNESLNDKILFHKPHPRKEMKRYVLTMIIDKLRENGMI